MKAAALAFSGKYDFTATIVVSSDIVRASETFCLQLPGCKTFVVGFGAFLKLTFKFASLLKTSWKVFRAISSPGTLIGSLNPENSNGGNINSLHFNRIYERFFINRQCRSKKRFFWTSVAYIIHPDSG